MVRPCRHHEPVDRHRAKGAALAANRSGWDVDPAREALAGRQANGAVVDAIASLAGALTPLRPGLP